MLLAVDIGNSKIKFGIYDRDNLASNFQIDTHRNHSRGDLIAAIGGQIDLEIDRVIVCSVVPELNLIIRETLREKHSVEAYLVENDADFGLQIEYRPLAAAGTDRLVNCFSAAEKYGAPAIVCSFGTALTFDVVDDGRTLSGGVIAPGIKPLAKALHLVTSRLPEVAIEKPERVIQQTTVESIQSGLINGYLAMFRGLLDKVSDELGSRPKVIATGGLSQFVADETGLIDVVDPRLTLDGLNSLARRLGI